MGTKGTWHRPGDTQKYGAEHDRIFGKSKLQQRLEDELKSEKLNRDSHYEEAACISDEMRLHQEKMNHAE